MITPLLPHRNPLLRSIHYAENAEYPDAQQLSTLKFAVMIRFPLALQRILGYHEPSIKHRVTCQKQNRNQLRNSQR